MNSRRTFKLWEYQVSHGQLLIRSPKSPATARSPAETTNLDVLCQGVDYLAIPRVLRGLELVTPTDDEVARAETALGAAVKPDNVRVLASEGRRHIIVAATVTVNENEADIFESPFEFRSRPPTRRGRA